MIFTGKRKAILAAAVAAVLIAWVWKSRHDAQPPAVATAPEGSASSAAPAPLSASQVERGIDNAREAVERDPKDAGSWAMLAHSYEMVGQFDKAGPAYEKLIELRPQDAQALADYADALGVAQHGSLQGKPAQLIARALTIAPNQLKALVLAGKEAFERKRYAEAIAYWQRALAAAPEAPVRRAIETSIGEAQAFAAPASAAASAAGGLAFVAGRVALAEALKAQASPDDTVFIYARPADGSRMPVALLRKQVRDLPLDFALDDTLAMVPQSRLSQHPQVLVGARVSKRGDAIPVTGDLEGSVGPIKLGSTGIKLEIDHVHP